jgi:hypothetical protein
VVLATLTDIYILDHSVSYREIIVTLVALAGFSVLVAGDRGLKVGLVYMVMTFGLGYRTMDLTSSLKVHPSELVLWGLLALLIVQPAISRQNGAKIWLPRWLILFIPFWLWAWVPGLSAGLDWSEMFNEFKNFAMLVPLFIIAEMVIADRTSWRHVLLTFYGVGTWIAAMGVLEYIFPAIKNVFPGFITRPEGWEDTGGFIRASFSFWGSPAATLLLVLTAPIATVMWRLWSMPWQRVLTILALAVQAVGIYIGGYRSMWLTFVIELVVFGILRRKLVVAAVCLLLPLLGSWLLPPQARERVSLLISLLAGNPQTMDTSGIKRWGRISAAMTETLDKPLGHGWSEAGWVHNDFIQVASNLGLLAGLLFAGAFLFTVWRLWRRVSASSISDDYYLGLALLLSFTGVGATLGMEGAEVLPQFVLPIWFVWVLVEVWLRQTPKARRIFNGTPPYISTTSDLQLRRDRTRYAGID